MSKQDVITITNRLENEYDVSNVLKASLRDRNEELLELKSSLGLLKENVEVNSEGNVTASSHHHFGYALAIVRLLFLFSLVGWKRKHEDLEHDNNELSDKVIQLEQLIVVLKNTINEGMAVIQWLFHDSKLMMLQAML
jgi:hypothetical protein